MTPIVARAAAQARGPPANVLPCSLFLNSSPSRAMSAPMGNPLASPFAVVTISGVMPACWKANHFPVRHAGLHLIDDHQSTGIVAYIPDAPEEIVGRYKDARLPLDRLDKDTGCIPVDRCGKCVEVAVVYEGAGDRERLERFPDRGFVGDRKRSECPPVEPVGKRGKLLPPRPDAGKFDRTVVCLRTGVCEEDLCKARYPDEFCRKLGLVRDVVEV